MRKIREVLRLNHLASANVREIAASCGIAPSTVSEYLRRAKASGLGWPLPPELADEDLESRLFPERHTRTAHPLPDWSQIQKESSRKGVTLELLWREYRERHADGYGRSQFNALYRQWLKSSDLRMVQRHTAGERMWVDWSGLGARLTDESTGEVMEVPVFVAAFGMSQKLYCRACLSQDIECWLDAHVRALEFYGVSPQIAVPDNTKTAVTSPERYEPVLNPEYVELASHYQIAVVPARVRKPRDKAKVENGVQQIERHVLAPLRDRTFFSLEELNSELERLTQQLNARRMKGPDASRDELFQQFDLPAARPLPERRYEFARRKNAKVGPDYHVEFEGHRYSVPYQLVGKSVELRASTRTVQVFSGSKTVASHPRSSSRIGFTTDESHMPKAHQDQAEWTPARLVRWASEYGESVAAFVDRLLNNKVHAEHGFRSAIGLISLGKRYGQERLQRACERALSAQAISYRSVKSILEKNLDHSPEPEADTSMPAHTNVRGPEYYKEVSS